VPLFSPAPDSRLCVGRARSPRTLLVGPEGGRWPFARRVPRYPPSRRHSRCRLPASVMCAASRNAAAAADPPPGRRRPMCRRRPAPAWRLSGGGLARPSAARRPPRAALPGRCQPAGRAAGLPPRRCRCNPLAIPPAPSPAKGPAPPLPAAAAPASFERRRRRPGDGGGEQAVAAAAGKIPAPPALGMARAPRRRRAEAGAARRHRSGVRGVCPPPSGHLHRLKVDIFTDLVLAVPCGT
jgi:hypothetical protein